MILRPTLCALWVLSVQPALSHTQTLHRLLTPLEKIEKKNPFAATLTSNCLQKIAIDRFIKDKFIYLKYTNPRHFRFPLYLTAKFHPPRHDKKKKRHILFIIPGIFNNARSTESNQLTLIAFKNGLHAVQLPNFLSQDYIKAQPHHQLADIISVAEYYITIIRSTLNILKDRGFTIDKVKLAGLSLGAFASSIIAGLDEDHLLSQLLLIAPAHHLRESIELIDREIDEVRQDIRPRNTLRSLPSSIKTCFAKDEKNIDEEQHREIKTLVLQYGFIEQLIKMMKRIKKNDPTKFYEYNINLDEFKNRPELYSYQAILKELYSDLEEFLNSPKQDLFHWLKKSRENRSLDNPIDIKIITSEDDFIVKKSSWPKTGQFDIIMYPYGGHMGYTILRSFKELIAESIESLKR